MLLEKVKKEGLFLALEKGIFANVKRYKTSGKGLDGVVLKGNNYINPFVELMKNN
jgi:beta-lysine 5,6-aminomutase alpha subunit